MVCGAARVGRRSGSENDGTGRDVTGLRVGRGRFRFLSADWGAPPSLCLGIMHIQCVLFIFIYLFFFTAKRIEFSHIYKQMIISTMTCTFICGYPINDYIIVRIGHIFAISDPLSLGTF